MRELVARVSVEFQDVKLWEKLVRDSMWVKWVSLHSKERGVHKERKYFKESIKMYFPYQNIFKNK